MKKMMSVLLAMLCLLAAALPAAAFQEVRISPPDLPLCAGDSAFEIYMLKRALYSMGYEDVNDHRDHPRYAPEFTQAFDRWMLDAVLAVQKAQGLEESGEVDALTMEAILPGYLAAVGSGALILGTMSARVRQMQEDLTALGCYSHDITGNMGEYTEEAVRRFQQQYGLTSNGYADEATLDAIAQALAAQ